MKQRKPNPRRLKLIELSGIAKGLIENCDPALEAVEGELNVNNVIMTLLYPIGEYHTFSGWKEEGMKVKKGEHGLPIWGRPRKFTKKQESADGETAEEKKYKAFPVAYLFEREQVEEAA